MITALAGEEDGTRIPKAVWQQTLEPQTEKLAPGARRGRMPVKVW